LINGPRLLLADEPTGSLDARSADQLGELLRNLNAEKSVALVTVTHSARLAALMKTTFELENGELARSERVSDTAGT
jgi:ABC-type lipoprotein export system ATPase subunit